jgi:glycolate oxidase iron-sulfur subunit
LNINQTISRLANQCVMCGLCLPHCPTYTLFLDENESPRGRISLLKAMAEKQLDVSLAFVQHIDHCLGCRACENMCPSEVKYADIINLGREFITTEHKLAGELIAHQSTLEKMLLKKSWHPWIKAGSALAGYGRKMSGEIAGKLVDKLTTQSTVSRLSAIAAEVSRKKSLERCYPVSEPVASIALFTGCVGELFDQQTLLDTIKLLNACHIEVVIPKQQCCCGALSQRHGNINEQTRLAEQNLKAFNHRHSAIISTANSCSAQLKEYAQHSGLDPIARKQFALKVSDSLAYLNRMLKTTLITTANAPSGQPPVAFSPLKETILVHTSCSLKNVLHEEPQLLELLGHIPDIRLKIINQQYCCGAAGTYMLKYPDIADKLLDLKIDDIIESGSRILISSNIGCSLHIKQRLQQLDYAIEIIHPVSLLLKQLKIEAKI